MKKIIASKYFKLIGTLVVIFIILFPYWESKNNSVVPQTPSPTPDSQSAAQITYPPQRVVFTETDNKYKILYTSYNNLYSIIILDKNFEKVRLVAEKQLIKQLKISAEEACKLNLTISSPHFVDPSVKRPTYFSLTSCK